jgi:DNA polymerase (family 10)
VVIDGLQVDCRAVAPEQFGAAWQYFTGSQMHNIKLRGMALRLGLTLNEYGVFRVDDGTRVTGETEEDVYESLGLRWIPPEQREDRGEVEAARIEAAGVSSSATSSSAEEG